MTLPVSPGVGVSVQALRARGSGAQQSVPRRDRSLQEVGPAFCVFLCPLRLLSHTTNRAEQDAAAAAERKRKKLQQRLA